MILQVRFKRILILTGFTLFLLLQLLGCSKDEDTQPGVSYPKEVDVEYRATLLTGSLTKLTTTMYTNATGVDAIVSDTALPFTVKFKRTVNRGDKLLLSVFHNNSATNSPFTIKLEILADNEIVEAKTFERTSAINEAIVYFFP